MKKPLIKILFIFLNCFLIQLNSQNLDTAQQRIQIDSLLKLSRQYLINKSNDTSLIIIDQAAALLAKENSTMLQAKINYTYGVHYQLTGNPKKAEEYYLKAIPFFDNKNPLLEKSYNNLGLLYSNDMQDYEKAKKVYYKLAKIRKKLYTEVHLGYAECMNNLGAIHDKTFDYKKAKNYLNEAKAIYQKLYGIQSEKYADVVYNLAVVESNLGNIHNSLQLYYESIKIISTVTGTQNQLYAKYMQNLGAVYFALYDFSKTDSIWKEILPFLEEDTVSNRIAYINLLNNFGTLKLTQLKYNDAEVYFTKALEIAKNSKGTTKETIAGLYSNLAAYYINVNNLDKAYQLMQDAQTIYIKNSLTLTPKFSSLQFLFATYYSKTNHSEKIDSCINLCIQITERIYTRAHPLFNELVFKIANLYFEIEKYNVAENLLEISRKNYNNELSKNEFDLVKLNMLQASIYSKNNLNNESIALLEVAKSIIEKKTGKKSAQYLKTIHDLAINFEKAKNYKNAEKNWIEYFKIKNNLLLEETNYLTNEELEHYTEEYANEINKLNSVIYHRAHNETEYDRLLSLSYNANLIYKRLLLNSSSRLYNLFAVPESVLRIKEEINNYQKKLATFYTNNSSKKDEIKYIEDLVRTKEKSLVKYLSEYSDDNLAVDWKEVKSALHEGEMAIEFIHFPLLFPNMQDSIIYAAIILKYGDNKPNFISLFEKKELDFILTNKGEFKSEYVNSLYGRSDRGLAPTEKNQKSIYDLIWYKIDSSGLDKINTVYYSPSGLLHRINLAAIKYGKRNFLDEKYQFVNLGSMKQLIPQKKEKIYTNKDAILIGGVDYNLDTINYALTNKAYQIPDTLKILKSEYMSVEEIVATRSNNEEWDALEGTSQEIKNISQHLKNNQYFVISLSGQAASEERFKAIGINTTSPRILHISTHGFFFDKNSNPQKNDNEHQAIFTKSENPLWRSGLIMAGANYAWQNKVPYGNFEDGILTAYEIAHMNLSNTELVVLSACESGLGDIKDSEGVYGLQRAFKIAGAKYIMISLWSIPDESTQQLMTLFYKFWMESQMPIHLALESAQREIRKKYSNPFYWAGFVIME